VFQTELRRRFPGAPIVIATLAADWGASYLPPGETYGKGIYQETIAVVAPGGMEQVIESVAKRIEDSLEHSAAEPRANPERGIRPPRREARRERKARS
jgi:hypothetical protein